MPWYNRGRIEPGKLGKSAMPAVVSSTGKAKAFPRYYESHARHVRAVSTCRIEHVELKSRTLLVTDGVADYARLDSVEELLAVKWRVKESSAPNFIAFTVIGM